MKELEHALSQHCGVHDWRFRRVFRREHQLYLTGAVKENTREVTSDTTRVTVYHDHPGRGAASFTLLPGDRNLEKRVNWAVLAAGMVSNPPHGLPAPAPYPQVQLVDAALAARAAGVIGDLADTLVEAVAAEQDVYLASAELFAGYEEVEFANSRGATGSYAATDLFLEFVITARSGASEAETYHSARRRATSLLDIREEAREQAQAARDTLAAGLPEGGIFPVVVAGRELSSLFAPFLFQLDAQNHYRKISRIQLGESVFGEREVTGDPLTLCSDSLFAWGNSSAPFDREGLPGRSLVLVQAGRARALLATQQYAEYLGVTPTGTSGCTVVQAGPWPARELEQQARFLLTSFSSLQVDPITGNFAGEIRLGYDLSGADPVPVKGGSIAGNVFEALAGARYSREQHFTGGFQGPRAVFLPATRVSGR